jgi:hypothetical protein
MANARRSELPEDVVDSTQAGEPTPEPYIEPSITAPPAAELPKGHFADDHYLLEHAISHGEELVGYAGWIVRAALHGLEKGALVTIDEVKKLVDEFLKTPVDAKKDGED